MSDEGTAGEARRIAPVRRLNGRVTAPPSKSVTQRALIAASLARGVSRLRRPLLADDAQQMMAALNAVGVAVSRRDAGGEVVLEVDGNPGARPAGCPTLNVGNAGTAMRFLAARLALGDAPCILDGDPRMRQRPIEDLLAALRQLGGAAEALHGDGCPPVRIGGRPLRGGRARLSGARSSQYLSALLLAGPGMADGVDIEIEGDLVSRPYVDLTLDTMRRFGVQATPGPPSAAVRRFTVPAGQCYRPTDLLVEGDYSSASYFFAAAAIVPGRVEVSGLDPRSLQGDALFLDLLQAMGCRVERRSDSIAVEGPERLQAPGVVDLAGMPDLAPTLAVVALFADGETEIRGVPHLRLKESDRIAVLCEAIALLGGDARATGDGLVIRTRRLKGALINPHGDHRMAMAFAVAGLRVPDLTISNPDCVSKSYPAFWDDFERLASGQ